MSRIRTIKPQFFRHELLQDLENEFPLQRIMLTFIGLLTVCDSKGRFENKPRILKLDILPFVNFDFDYTLKILSEHNFITFYEVDKNKYGQVINFEKHQRITGKEALNGEKYPGKHPGNTWETPGKHPDAQEREKEKEREILRSTHTNNNPRARENSTSENVCKKETIPIPESKFRFEKKYFIDEAKNCPHEKIIALYHEILPMLPKVPDWPVTHQQQLIEHWLEHPEIGWWQAFFEGFAKADWLLNEATFKPTLAWIIQPKNFQKIKEGTYGQSHENHNRSRSNGVKQSKSAQYFSDTIAELETIIQAEQEGG